MAFRFPLATVLRVRALEEERQERVLQQILTEIAHTEKLQAELEASLARATAKRVEQVQQRLTGSSVHRHYGEFASLRATEADLHAHREKLEALKERQVKIYATAHQNREMLSGLDEAQRAAYDLAATKREQKTLDDLFGARIHRK